jgi:hypothetical protein|tara:strand:+ start:109 stop:318 length:210 start_codon:yes stop_codon:yes gene_type:complete
VKNGRKKKKNLELVNATKIKIFVKKPQRGGTPAIDKMVKDKILVSKFEDPKSAKEKRVFVSRLVNWKRV